MRLWWVPLMLVPLLAGCSEDAPAEEPVAPVEAPPTPDPWNGADRAVLLDIDSSGYQMDVLCVFGGGVEMQRADGGGRVWPGTDHVEAFVDPGQTSTGMQLGYVLTEDPGYDEREQEGITWLEPVVGQAQRFTIPVTEEQWETDGKMLWRFYLRMNVPAGEAPADPDCYTGLHYGEYTLKAEAVKG